MHTENGRTLPPPLVIWLLDCFAMLRHGKNIPSFKDRLLELEITESISFQPIGPSAIGFWWKVFCGNYSFLARHVISEICDTNAKFESFKEV